MVPKGRMFLAVQEPADMRGIGDAHRYVVFMKDGIPGAWDVLV
jgi:hypothetical protein